MTTAHFAGFGKRPAVVCNVITNHRILLKSSKGVYGADSFFQICRKEAIMKRL